MKATIISVVKKKLQIFVEVDYEDKGLPVSKEFIQLAEEKYPNLTIQDLTDIIIEVGQKYVVLLDKEISFSTLIGQEITF